MHTRSCTEINALWKYLWPGGVSMLGWLMAPRIPHECAWVHDAQSVNGDPCPGGDAYHQASASIGTTLSWQLQIGRPMHNEVIISGDTFVQQLPSAIGAFVIVDCALYNQSWKPMMACLADDAPTRQDLVDGAGTAVCASTWREGCGEEAPPAPIPGKCISWRQTKDCTAGFEKSSDTYGGM